jgi:hypothetical protein
MQQLTHNIRDGCGYARLTWSTRVLKLDDSGEPLVNFDQPCYRTGEIETLCRMLLSNLWFLKHMSNL